MTTIYILILNPVKMCVSRVHYYKNNNNNNKKEVTIGDEYREPQC